MLVVQLYILFCSQIQKYRWIDEQIESVSQNVEPFSVNFINRICKYLRFIDIYNLLWTPENSNWIFIYFCLKFAKCLKFLSLYQVLSMLGFINRYLGKHYKEYYFFLVKDFITIVICSKIQMLMKCHGVVPKDEG